MKASQFIVVPGGKVLVIIEVVMEELALVKETIMVGFMEVIIAALMLPKVGLSAVGVMTSGKPK